MARMFSRALLLTLLVLAVGAPAAHAAVADRFSPVNDASDGVSLTRGAHGYVFHFAAKADRIFREIRGRHA